MALAAAAAVPCHPTPRDPEGAQSPARGDGARSSLRRPMRSRRARPLQEAGSVSLPLRRTRLQNLKRPVQVTRPVQDAEAVSFAVLLCSLCPSDLGTVLPATLMAPCSFHRQAHLQLCTLQGLSSRGVGPLCPPPSSGHSISSPPVSLEIPPGPGTSREGGSMGPMFVRWTGTQVSRGEGSRATTPGWHLVCSWAACWWPVGTDILWQRPSSV